MPTRRTPINRNLRQRITPEARGAYQTGDTMELHRLLGPEALGNFSARL
jgi:hypothetical protein